MTDTNTTQDTSAGNLESEKQGNVSILEALSSLLNEDGSLKEPEKTDSTPEKTESEKPDALEKSEDKTTELDVKDTSEEKDTDEVKQEEEIPTYKVKVNGEEFDVPVDELIKGYQRESDYTRKTMRLADERRNVEKHNEELQQAREQAKQERELTAQAIEQVLATAAALDPLISQESQIDWNKLYQEDPAQYMKLQADLNQRKSQLNALMQHRQMIEQQRQAEMSQLREHRVRHESEKLLEVMPELKDHTKSQELMTEMNNFLLSRGFSQQELANVIDHRVFPIIKQALLYEKAMKQQQNKPTAKPTQTPTMKSGTPKSTAEIDSEKAKLALNKFKKSGAIEDGAALLIAAGIV